MEILASEREENEKPSGVVSATRVVTTKFSENHPTVRVAVLTVLLFDEDVSRT